jgi:bifunctional DNase/RNase
MQPERAMKLVRIHWWIVPAALWAVSGCKEQPPAEIPVRVEAVAFDYASRSPVVVLAEKQGKRQLPIWIGPGEAQAIAMRLEGMTPPRPLTHDLLHRLLQEAGVEVEKVVVTALKDGVYFAEIHLHGKKGAVKVDSRPSDAIALAVRCEKPIYVARGLFEEQGQRRLLVHGQPELRARAGITVQNLTEELAELFGLEEKQGVVVTQAEAGTGLRSGDCILAIDGHAIRNVDDFSRVMDDAEPGSQVRVSVQRGKETLQLSVPVQGS